MRFFRQLRRSFPFFMVFAVCFLFSLTESSKAFASPESFQLPSYRVFVEPNSKGHQLPFHTESFSFARKKDRLRLTKKPLMVAQAMAHQPPMRSGEKKVKENEDTITGLVSILNVSASFNLLGLRVIATIGYRWRLYASNSKAFKDNYVSVNAISRLTPAWMEFGGLVAVQPAAFIRFRGAYRYRFQLPTFFSGGVFESAETAHQAFANLQKYSEGEQLIRDTIEARSKENGGSRILPGSHIAAADVTLRMKFRGVLLLANARYARWWSSYNQQDKFTAFYEGGHDMIFNADEHFLMVDAGLGYQWRNFRFLAITSYRKAFNANSEYNRVGPAFQWLIAKRWKRFKNPALLVAVNWYTMHQWRGRDGIPLIALRFGGEF